jgi:hypothetical protein
MPALMSMRASGLRIWPFDGPPEPPASTVFEIYPRWFTGPVYKGSRPDRRRYLQEFRLAAQAEVPSDTLGLAEAREDAFDALVSGVGMAQLATRRGFEGYGDAFYADREIQLEGWILGPTPPR